MSGEGGCKRCPRCKTDKPFSAFNKCRSRADGLMGWCRERQSARRKEASRHYRSYEMQRRYGITLDEYEAMLEAQGGGCVICGQRCVQHESLSIDHCHATGKVCGLLCGKCNQGIGMFNDKPELLMSALNYLEVSRAG